MKNILTIIFCCTILVGCSTISVTTKPIDRVNLDIDIPEPIELRTVKWKILKSEEITYFSLDTKNFENLTKNTEDVQNRLYLQHIIIENQKMFYENNKELDK